MTKLTLPMLGVAAVTLGALTSVGGTAPSGRDGAAATAPPPSRTHAVADTLARDSVNAIIQGTCVRCHSDRRLRGNLSLEAYDALRAPEHADVSEKIVRKLRAGMMPPPGGRRPARATLEAMAETLEGAVDRAAAASPRVGGRTFQRLNRAEYAASIDDLLALRIDAGAFLPLDTKSANFDNIADVQLLSTTLMDSYLRAASEISRLAVGDPDAAAAEATYRVSRWTSQTEHVPGTPYGTRGGLSVVHTFPADGQYRFRVSFHHETTGAMHGSGGGALHTLDNPERVEISVDGVRVALLEVDRWMHTSDPDGVNIRSDPIRITAGPHRIAAAFIRMFEGPVQDLISPHEWSIASTSIADAYGFTSMPHIRDMAVTGPFDPDGVSETPSRSRIFACWPTEPADEAPCAESILTRLATQAYRRPLAPDEGDALMGLYRTGAAEGGFEEGVRLALEGILANPKFVFRFEEPPAGAQEGQAYPLGDFDLASRLSFFLWGRGPDQILMDLAARGELGSTEALERQVSRMLADPRSEALATRFAFQWLRLQDLERIHPDVRVDPDFDEQLKAAMLRETELFFYSLVREDRSVLDLFTADYTFVNERLATHYGIPGIEGPDFQRVTYTGARRRGLLGHGSVLTLTSHASRTSPVLRGKWVMEVFLGSPPPPPPPDVPELEETEATEDGRLLTVRELMAMHAANPTCNSCHRMMDPIGLALENFGVSGGWRVRDNGMPVDASGELYDGTPLTGPEDLRQALLSRPEPLLRTFTENLMAYALGRRVEYYDMPTVRRIVREAADRDYRVSAFVAGIATSPAFRMKTAEAVVDAEAESDVRESPAPPAEE